MLVTQITLAAVAAALMTTGCGDNSSPASAPATGASSASGVTGKITINKERNPEKSAVVSDVSATSS